MPDDAATEAASNRVWPDGVTRVPFWTWQDPDVLIREQQRLFEGPVWNYLCLETEIPNAGDWRATYVGEMPVVVARDHDGAIVAFENRCAHRGALICLDDGGNAREFHCVYHAWRYDLRGTLRSIAFQRGVNGAGGMPAGFRIEHHGPRKLRTTVLFGIVFGTLSGATPDIETFAGPEVIGRLRTVAAGRSLEIIGRVTQVLPNNWKLYAENVRDTYHASLLHLFFATFKLNRLSQSGGTQINGTGSCHVSTTLAPDQAVDHAYDGMRSVDDDFRLNDPSLLDAVDEHGDRVRQQIISVFPTFVMQRTQNVMAVRHFLPRGPHKTDLHWIYLGYADDTPELRTRRLRQLNLAGPAGYVSMEDGCIGGFVERGAAAAYDHASIVEMGGAEIKGQETRATEAAIRGFWRFWRGHLKRPASWHDQGRAHLDAGRFAEAHACLIRAAELHPDDDTILADLARALYLGGRADQAVPMYRGLVARQPDNISIAVDLGRAQRAIAAYTEAIETYHTILVRAPGEAAVLNNLGNCQLALGDTDAAIASLRRASEANPDFIDAHYNLGLALLTAGHMREGWAEYRWRLRMERHFVDGKPLLEWDGTPMPEKILFVRPEQGLGDTIQFCRYLPLIAPRARVVLGVPRALHRLSRDLPGVEQVITEGDPRPSYDAECVVMSLPGLLGAYGPEDAGSVPYLRTDPTATAKWRSRLAALPGPRIGLVWAGSPGFGAVTLADRRRSLPLAMLAPLRGDRTFVSLQKGPAAAQSRQPPRGMALVDWTDELHDFADTAALIAALDLVIGVDTAVAHLAGALGRPVWLLNRTDTDWRWGVSGETTRWYPTMRIFRQASQGDWTAPIAAVAAALNQASAIRIGMGPEVDFSRREPSWPTPRWDGSPMDGETLLLHADNVEDVLLAGRYITAAVARSRARVVLSVPPALRRLMGGRSNVTIAIKARPSHDRHCPIAALPTWFRNRSDSILDIDLCPPPPLPAIEAWSPAVTRLRGLRVGVAVDESSLLTAIGRVGGVNLVALRPGINAPDLHDWSAGFDDLATVASLIMHLDLVIAGDNEIAHLAAALGRPVWLVSPTVPRWPWLPDREDNPWYPTLRQFPHGSAEAIATALAALPADTPEEATFAYANDCYRREDFHAAATGFRQTLALKSNHPGALGNLAVTMLTLGCPEIALRYAEQSVRVVPTSHPLRLRLGLALHACGRFQEAASQLRAAHAMQPEHTDTLTALGNALGATGALREAIAMQRLAVAAAPDNAGYHTNLAYALLRVGQWQEGWREHEYRPQRPRGGKLWNGRGTPLLLCHEQGIGDIIQFCRFAPMAAERSGGAVFLTVPRPLRDLLRGLRGVSVLTPDEPLPTNAYQFPLLSLPLLFNTVPATLPAEVPYLYADPPLVARWHRRISTIPGFRIGLAWAGNPRLGTASLGATDRRRSLPDKALAPLAGLPGVSFVSLQVGDAAPPGVDVTDWTSELVDFAHTAALIMTLDLVISVDTAVAHLAGALGKPVWLLNRFDTDWRWMDGRDDSVWYPTMRQFRQTLPGDWAAVIDRVARTLAEPA